MSNTNITVFKFFFVHIAYRRASKIIPLQVISSNYQDLQGDFLCYAKISYCPAFLF